MRLALREHRRSILGVALAFAPLFVGVAFGLDGIFLLHDVVAGVLTLAAFALVVGLLVGFGVRLVRG